MERVMAHPITLMFHDRIAPSEEEDEYRPVKSIGFNDILQGLKNHEYKEMQEWLEDVEIVCHNIEEWYSENSFEAVSAREVRRRFNKERSQMHSLSRSAWVWAMQKQRIRVAKLISMAPQKLKTMIPQISGVELPPKRQLKYTDHEIQTFLLAMEELDTQEEFDGLTAIIDEAQPGALKVPSVVNFTYGQLSDTTLDRVKDYVEKCLARKGRRMMK